MSFTFQFVAQNADLAMRRLGELANANKSNMPSYVVDFIGNAILNADTGTGFLVSCSGRFCSAPAGHPDANRSDLKIEVIPIEVLSS